MSDQGCREIEEALEEFALSFPEAWLDRPWGVDRVVKVRKKIFAFLSESTDACTALGVKLPESAEAMLLEPWATPSGHGLGRSGWVTMRFGDPEDVPLDLLARPDRRELLRGRAEDAVGAGARRDGGRDGGRAERLSRLPCRPPLSSPCGTRAPRTLPARAQ